jgi:hypothetical protein
VRHPALLVGAMIAATTALLEILIALIALIVLLLV